jgi:glutamyl/glutaminyl-tRNA synthetase
MNIESSKTFFSRTRLAPTPSGYLHIGNILSFAITTALANKFGAKVLLRIDDFDQERTNRLIVEDIFDTLEFLEIHWDEGPRNYKQYYDEFSQRHRMPIYHEALQQLKDTGALFACSCSRAQVIAMGHSGGYSGLCKGRGLQLESPKVSWRLDTSKTGQILIHNLGGTTNAILPEEMHNFIVRRKDLLPAYQLISVVDDQYYDVDLIVRGNDLWPSTIAQCALARHLGMDQFSKTTFFHHSLIEDNSGVKLSKSEGATSIHFLRQNGVEKAGIFRLIVKAIGVNYVPQSWVQLMDIIIARFPTLGLSDNFKLR